MTDALCLEGNPSGSRALPPASLRKRCRYRGSQRHVRRQYAEWPRSGQCRTRCCSRLRGTDRRNVRSCPRSRMCCAASARDSCEHSGVTDSGPESDSLSRYSAAARLLTGNPNAAPEDAVGWLTETCTALNIPRLGSYGIESGHIPELVAKAKNASSMKSNPIVLTDSELQEILALAI